MKTTDRHTGLTAEQVAASRAEHGENLLTPPPRPSIFKLFFEKFEDPIIRVLLVAATLSLVISVINDEYAETIGIFCAIFLATAVGFWFEWDARRKFDLLSRTGDDTAVKVVRDGVVGEIPRREVVVGDVVLLDTGEEIPADGELIESVSLSVNESTLTGEPVTMKTTDPDHFKADATYPSNRLLRGTTVVEGTAVMCIDAVGDSTEYGNVAREATASSEEPTPLNFQLEKLAKVIGVAGFTLALVTFWILFVKDIVKLNYVFSSAQIYSFVAVIAAVTVASVKIWMPVIGDAFALVGREFACGVRASKRGWWLYLASSLILFFVLATLGKYALGIDMTSSEAWISMDLAQLLLQSFMVAVTLIVVAVPEGLPMSVTLSLALSMRKMLKTNNLVRKMHACETMGATTVICTDKTGTLTQNQMQVWQTDFYSLHDQTLGDNHLSYLIEEGIAVNSTAHLDLSDPATPKVLGNPTEGALLLWLKGQGVDYSKLRDRTELIDRKPFTTETKCMITLVGSHLLGRKVLYIKGAPEIILGKCSKVVYHGEDREMTAVKPEIEKQLTEYQNKAMRTLGFGYLFVDDAMTVEAALAANSEFIFLGVTAISDPVRDEVPAAVRKCLDAGIQIKIVTGDTPATAREIARQIGLWHPETDGDRNLITGTDFAALSDEELLERVDEIKIMSRARPLDKQRLVKLLQRRGHVVAVTGDGTNDAPALNFAQVGLSMGSGTSVAKEASDITLLDDSFNSIATAVLWGRSLYRNIQRFIVFQLTINFAALLIVLLGSIFGAEVPLTVTQMLWVNLIMDTFAAGALASLPPDPTVMKEHPRRMTDFIVLPHMVRNILSVGTIFVAVLLLMLWKMTAPDGTISTKNLTIFFTVFVLIQFWNMFNAKAIGTGRSAFSRMRKSGAFLVVLVLILVGQILIVNFGGAVFRTVPLSSMEWISIIGVTSLVLWCGEFVRLVERLKMKEKLDAE